MSWLQERVESMKTLIPLPRSRQGVQPTERLETLAASPLLSESESFSE